MQATTTLSLMYALHCGGKIKLVAIRRMQVSYRLDLLRLMAVELSIKVA